MILAFGIAIGVLFVFLTPGYVPELNSFLFGNVLTIAESDLWAFGIYTLALIGFLIWKYRQIVACAFDRDFAKVMGLPTRFISYTMTVFIAVGIVLTIRLVGVMLLMAMLSLPMMVAETFCRSFGRIMIASIVVSVFCSMFGLFLGATADVPCSAFIVLTGVGCFVVSKVVFALKNSRQLPD